jgi:hypothetical protein
MRGVKNYVRARVFNDDSRFVQALLQLWRESRHAVGA